jgi:hypothetical protein
LHLQQLTGVLDVSYYSIRGGFFEG